MKKQAQLIFTHFGEEKQRLKAKEDFYFRKEEVRKWVERKIYRTIGKYGIGEITNESI